MGPAQLQLGGGTVGHCERLLSSTHPARDPAPDDREHVLDCGTGFAEAPDDARALHDRTEVLGTGTGEAHDLSGTPEPCTNGEHRSPGEEQGSC